MSKYGKSTLRLEWCLGIYATAGRGRCQFRHAITEHITDTFCHKLYQALAPGVQHMLRHVPTRQGWPVKHAKAKGNTQPSRMLGNVKSGGVALYG